MSIIAKTLDEASTTKGEIRAGGTDYMERRRRGISTGEVVDISQVPDLDAVHKFTTHLSIDALVSLKTVAEDPNILRDYPGLAIAAGALATPQIRNAASLAGSLLQRTRCWYYRHEDFNCFKKGGDTCFAREGNHQFGVCFDLGPCVFPHPSTLGMALMAYDAEIEIHGKEKRPIAAIYGDGKQAKHDHLLAPGEIISSIHLPPPVLDEVAAYFRSISRARAEWPLVEVLVRYRLEAGKIADSRVAIGGIAPVPLRLSKVESYLNGKLPGEKIFKQAGDIAAEGANPLPNTSYKVELVKGTVYETLRRAAAGETDGEG